MDFSSLHSALCTPFICKMIIVDLDIPAWVCSFGGRQVNIQLAVSEAPEWTDSHTGLSTNASPQFCHLQRVRMTASGLISVVTWLNQIVQECPHLFTISVLDFSLGTSHSGVQGNTGKDYLKCVCWLETHKQYLLLPTHTLHKQVFLPVNVCHWEDLCIKICNCMHWILMPAWYMLHSL